MTVFTAVKGQRQKQGTGCVSQLGDHLWEGKYSPRGPDGKKRSGTSMPIPARNARKS